jgi:hypothetical protein
MLVENVDMDVLVEIYINDLETVKMDNIHYIIISYLLSSCPQHPFTTNSCFIFRLHEDFSFITCHMGFG